MRKLLAIVICASLLSVTQAQTVGQIITPTPISIALTIGQWLMMDRKKLYYIEVESRAPTFQQAKDEGFRLAVEHAVGSLLLAETDVRTGRLSRDEIITYASGYVDRFEIVQRIESGEGVILQIKVWVAHSAIANRLLNQSEIAGQLDGERTATQIDTINQNRQAGDRVLTTVLADYPKRAFDIKLEYTRVIYNSARQPELQTSFFVNWNQDYLTSINETLKAINQKTGCDSMFKRCMAVTWVNVNMPGFTSNRLYGFDDMVSWHQFQQHTVISRPSILAQIKDINGQVQFRQCFQAPELDHGNWAPWYYVDIGPGQITLNGGNVKRYDLNINLQHLKLENIGAIELSVVRANDC